MNVDQTKKIVADYSFYLRDKLGCGSSSEVYRGLSLKTSEAVAVKVIPQPPGAREAVAVLADAEIENLKKLKNSANIIQLKSAIQTKNNLYIITELCEGGTLEAQLAKARRLDEKIAVGVMEQLVAGCRDLVRCRVIHRDLKPTNIFRKGSEYKIGDFGFAISVEQCGEAKGENVGSPSYMPIESLKLNQYSHQGDIWALGIIFFQLLTGKTPWKSRTEKDLLRQIEDFKLHTIIPKLIGPGSKKFLERALTVDVADRMTVEELMEWKFYPSEEEGGLVKLKLHLQKPLRSTYDLHQMGNLKTVLGSMSQANLHVTPQKTSEMPGVGVGNQCFKVKRGQVSIDFAKKSERTAETVHTMTASIENISSIQDFSKSPLKTIKQIRTNSHPGVAVAKQPTIPDLRAKTESFTTMERLSTTTRNLPEPFQGLVSQLQAQMNYARFLLRLLRKLNDGLLTKNSHVLELKQALLYFLYVKLAEIKDLRFAKATFPQKQDFLLSPHYASVLALLAKYRERARQEGAKLSLNVSVRSEKEFLSTLGGVMGYLYSHVAPLRSNQEELGRRRAVVAILEDLVTLSELFMLQREEDWIKFRDNSGIAWLLGKTLPEVISPAYFQAVEASIFRLAQA